MSHQALLLRTTLDHEDRPLLEQALLTLQGIRHEAAEAAKDVGELHDLVELDKRFRNLKGVRLPVAGRRLIRHGYLERMCRRANKRFYFHLFSDCLIYSDKQPGGFKVHHSFPLADAYVEDLEELVEFASPKSKGLMESAPPHSFKFLSPH